MIGTYEGWVATCDTSSCKSEVRGKSKHSLQEKAQKAGWQLLPGDRALCHGCVGAKHSRDWDFFCPNKCGTVYIGIPDWVAQSAKQHLEGCHV